jgi:DNA polymerase-3 subunit gamma/tau
VLSIDSSRVSDPEIAAESERQALLDLSRRFSGEDLLRAFDVLTKAEYDIKGAAQPRYHLEMALLRWIHLRKLVPLTELIQQVQGGAATPSRPAPVARAVAPPAAAPVPRAAAPSAPTPPAPAPPARSDTVRAVEGRRAASAPVPPKPAPAGEGGPNLQQVDAASLKEAFLAEIRKTKKFFHGTVVAQAQKIDFEGDKVVFTFGPQHRALRAQLEQNRPWLESAASQLAGRKIMVTAAEGSASGGPPSPVGSPTGAEPAGFGGTPSAAGAASVGPVSGDRKDELKQRAMADTGVQTMLDVFAAEIKDVEEM